jgi:hypothetical protein
MGLIKRVGVWPVKGMLSTLCKSYKRLGKRERRENNRKNLANGLFWATKVENKRRRISRNRRVVNQSTKRRARSHP